MPFPRRWRAVAALNPGLQPTAGLNARRSWPAWLPPTAPGARLLQISVPPGAWLPDSSAAGHQAALTTALHEPRAGSGAWLLLAAGRQRCTWAAPSTQKGRSITAHAMQVGRLTRPC